MSSSPLPRSFWNAMAWMFLLACQPDGPALEFAIDDDVGVVELADRAAPGDVDVSDAEPDATSEVIADAGQDADSSSNLTIMTLNVGTRLLAPDPDDVNSVHYLRRVANAEYEDFIGARVRAMEPDLVALQEVLPPESCSSFIEEDPARTCFEADRRPDAVSRLLGPSYAVVCDGRKRTSCLGVRRGFGTLASAMASMISEVPMETALLPLPECDLVGGGCDEEHCDDESSASFVEVETTFGPVRVVAVALNGGGIGAGRYFAGQACRIGQLDQAFAFVAPGQKSLVLGDFSFDSDLEIHAQAKAHWDAMVGVGRLLTEHDARGLDGRRISTTTTERGGEDHVLSNFALGRCEVLGDPTFDASFDFSTLPAGAADRGRLDHRAVFCRLSSL
ncbi:MAG: hypothetical protein EXR76_11610 [Myxococcales bacterium]|nr:hypothetical protein [Myxococcales bacterium]